MKSNDMKTFLLMLFTLLAMILPARTDAQETAGAILTRVECEYPLGDIRGGNSGYVVGGFTKDGKGRAVFFDYVTDDRGWNPVIASLNIVDEKLEKNLHMIFEPVLAYPGSSTQLDELVLTRFCDVNIGHDVYSSVPVTQTLFNSDEKYEMIVGVYDEGFTDDRRMINGFKVINEDRVCLFQESFEEKTISMPKFSFINIGESVYLWVEDDNHDKVFGCYLIEPEKSSLRRVELPKGLKAMPNVARASENVNLTFPEVAETRTVSLVNTSGRLVRTDRIAAGIGSYSLNTGNLAPGLYVVTLSDGTTSIETAKIIIR